MKQKTWQYFTIILMPMHATIIIELLRLSLVYIYYIYSDTYHFAMM